MTEDLHSPPYPGDGTNPALLFKYLGELSEWVNLYRQTLNEGAGVEIIPALRTMPAWTIYQAQPVPVMWSHFIVMRRIREEWDHLVRQYEDAWDCTACARQRIVLVQTAALMFNDAFVSYEQREAVHEREIEQIDRMWNNLRETLLKAMDPKYYDAKTDQHAHDADE